MKKYAKYKPSNIDWIGEIPENWRIKKIKHNCYVKARVGWKGLKSDEFLSDGYAYLITGQDFKNSNVNWKECYCVDEIRYSDDPFIQLVENDLLLTKDGTIGKLAIVNNLDKPACLNSGIFVIRSLNDELKTNFLFWILKSKIFIQFNEYTSYGSTIQHLYQNVFVEFSHPLPSIEEQIAITNYLDKKTKEIDQLIEEKKQLIQLFEEEKKSIIYQAVTKGINIHAEMKDSCIDWIGKIPKHWNLKKVKHVFKSLNNIRIPLSSEERGKMLERKYDYYGASGIIDKVENYLFEEPLILIGEDGANLLTRNSRLVFIAKGKYWVNNHAHILRPKFGVLEYYAELLELFDFSLWVTGSAQPKLTSENLMNIQIIVPPEEEQELIIKFLEIEFIKINSKIKRTKKLIKLLTEYRFALINEAVTGKVKVID